MCTPAILTDSLKVQGGAPALTRRKIHLLCGQQTKDRNVFWKDGLRPKMHPVPRNKWVFLLVSASVPVCAQYLWMPERFTLFNMLLFFKCLFHSCLVAAKRLYCEWSRSVSTSQCPRGMPRARSVGLVENGQRAPSECKGALQDRQVSFTLTPTPLPSRNHTASAVIVTTKSPLNEQRLWFLPLPATNHASPSRIALTYRGETAWIASESETPWSISWRSSAAARSMNTAWSWSTL